MITNKTRKRVLAKKVDVAKSFWKKTIGLMFRKEIGDNGCLLMEFTREGFHSIWMLGMRFPIDIIFLDEKKKVVGLFEGVKPLGMHPATWNVYGPSKPAKWIVELNRGKISKTKTDIGDELSFGGTI